MDRDNQINADTAARFMREIEKCDAEQITIKMENAARQKIVSVRRGDWFEQAKAAGLPLAAFKLEWKRRALAKRREALDGANEPEDVDLADQISAALGDFATTGLGAAAVSGAAAPPKAAKAPRKIGWGKGPGVTGDVLASLVGDETAGDEIEDVLASLNGEIDDSVPDDDADLRPPFLRGASTVQ